MADDPQPPDVEVSFGTPSGLRVTSEHPYHILLVGDFAGSKDGSVSGPLQSGVVAVTADTCDEVMASASPSTRYTASDPVAAGNVMVEIDLAFKSLKDFEPNRLVERIPAAKTLMDIRGQIVGRLQAKVSEAQIADTVAGAAADASLTWLIDSMKWTAAPSAEDLGAVDDLLGQLDIGDDEENDTPPAPKKQTPLGAAISTAAGGGNALPAEEVAALRRTIAEIDRRVSSWLTSVLHAPQVMSLEAAWRSLAFLVSKIEFRKAIRLSILHAPADELSSRFVSLLIDPVFDKGADAPDVILVDRAFSNTASDMEMLDELAQHGASLPAVVIAGAAASMFGVKHAWQIATLPTIANTFDQWQYAKWKALRTKRYARSLGVVFGRGLLRAPYERGDRDSMEFGYAEPCIADRDLVWANGPIVAGCTIAQSFAERNWPTTMSGFVHGRVEGFKTGVGGKNNDKTFGPADTKTPQPKIEEMAAAGLNAVATMGDHPDVLLWNGLTVGNVQQMTPDAMFEVSLPYQLFASRLSTLLFLLKPHLSGMSVDKLKSFVTDHVREWIPFEVEPTEEQLSVQARPAEDAPGSIELALTVTPPPNILAGAIPVVVGYRVS
ncbi:MAG: type VI secretion system contractile sheath large subunit [Planctomycetes bacterium]|nr:type VI secretion system contractile sheath large subunit [Planctomycetota bacterium]